MEVLRFDEVGQDGFIAPAWISESFPGVVVPPVAAAVQHPVHRGAAAQHPPLQQYRLLHDGRGVVRGLVWGSVTLILPVCPGC